MQEQAREWPPLPDFGRSGRNSREDAGLLHDLSGQVESGEELAHRLDVAGVAVEVADQTVPGAAALAVKSLISGCQADGKNTVDGWTNCSAGIRRFPIAKKGVEGR